MAAGRHRADVDCLDRAARDDRPLHRRLSAVRGSLAQRRADPAGGRRRARPVRRLQPAAVVRARRRLGHRLLHRAHLRHNKKGIVVKLAFHDADTDTDTDFLADILAEDRRENVGVSFSLP